MHNNIPLFCENIDWIVTGIKKIRHYTFSFIANHLKNFL